MTRPIPTLLLAAMLLPASAFAVPPKVEIRAPLLGLARPGSWVPISVDVSSADGLEGTVEARFAGGGNLPVSRAFQVPRGGRKRVVVPVPVPEWESEILVAVEGPRGDLLSARKLQIPPGSAAQGSLRVAIVGEEPLGWPTLGATSPLPAPGHPDTAAGDGQRSVLVQNLMPADLPDHWFGYGSVDLLVWRLPEPSALTAEQQEALRGWIASGGTAIVSLGDGHASWTSSSLGGLVPLRTSGLVHSRPALDAVWEVAGSGLPAGVSKAPNASRDQPAERAGLPIVAVEPGIGTEVRLADRAGHPIVLTSHPGAGRLILLAFDVAAGELRGGFDRALFWRRLLGLLPAPPASEDDAESASIAWQEEASAVPPLPGIAGPVLDLPASCPWFQAAWAQPAWIPPEDVSAGIVASRQGWWSQASPALGSFQAAAPLSLAFILGFGIVYLLAIGPLDFLVLKRLGRPMLTWITFPVLAIGFSVAASLVISRQKAGDSEARCLTLLDVMPGPGVLRGTSWCALWSSRRSDLAIQPARGKGFVLPARRTDFLLAGEGAYDSAEAITGGDQRVLARPGEAVFAFEAAQWSTSLVRSSWIDPTQARAELTAAGDGEAEGAGVHNLSGIDLVDAWVVDEYGWYPVGRLAAGERRPLGDRRAEAPDASTFSDPEVAALWPLAVEPGEDPSGHLHLGGQGGRPMLVGFAAVPIGQPRFDGLGGPRSSVTLVRVQLSSPSQQREAP